VSAVGFSAAGAGAGAAGTANASGVTGSAVADSASDCVVVAVLMWGTGCWLLEAAVAKLEAPVQRNTDMQKKDIGAY
jgi:hypothetical protein